MSELAAAAKRLQALLIRETQAARRASLEELTALAEEKEDAIAALSMLAPAAGAVIDPFTRVALREMQAAAEENAMVLGAVAGAMEAVQERLRHELAEAANPGTYGPPGRGPRRPLRHSLAASLNQAV